MPERGIANIVLFDCTGKVVEYLHSGILDAGNHEFELSGDALSSGLYLLKMETAEKVIIKKVLKK